MTAPDVVVVGDVMTDVAVRLDGVGLSGVAEHSDTDARVTFGGGGAGGNVAAWLAWLGVDVGLVTCVGDDDRGRVVVDGLRRAGVDVRAAVDVERSTGTVVALVDATGERSMLTDRGANVALRADDLPGGWFRSGAHLHVSGYALFAPPARDAALEAIRRASDAGMRRSVDPASWAPLRRVGADRFLAWTADVDELLPNADEAAVLTGIGGDVVAAARRLGGAYGSVVVTAGADGAVWSDGAAVLVREVHDDAADADEGDATGAGDAFTAGWLAARLSGAAPADALDRALATAAVAVRRSGARPQDPGPRP